MIASLMNYVNPLSLLGLNEVSSTEELTSQKIKKAKKIIVAEISLSDDDYIEYANQHIVLSDVERLVDELDDQLKIQYFDWIHPRLHKVEGDKSNSQYWYRNANQDHFSTDADVELELMGRHFSNLVSEKDKYP